MITSILTTVAVALLAAAPSDREQIQGSWKLVLRQGDRMWTSPELSSAFTITTFRGDERLTERISDEAEKRDTFVLHPWSQAECDRAPLQGSQRLATTHVGAPTNWRAIP